MSSQQGTFRSHWVAPPQQGRTPDMYDYDPNYSSNKQSNYQLSNQSSNQSNNPPASQSNTQPKTTISLDAPVTNERAPLLGATTDRSISQSHSQSNNQSNKLFGLFNSWASLCCCLIPLILLILLIVRYMMGDHATDASIIPSMHDNHAIAAQCDPFSFVDHSVDLSNRHGIVAYLSVVPRQDQSHCKSVEDFQSKSQRVNGTLFFSQLKTPTRLFTDRFVARDTLEESDSNNQTNQITLPSEYFLLDMYTRVLPPKKYRNKEIQLAIICDDGCVVSQLSDKHADKQSNKIDEDEILIDNDGIHTTQFAAADRPITFSSNEPINLSIKYFQGPPAHIALYMMYRTYRNESTSADDQQGNELYWHISDQPNTESTPTENFDRLVEEKWEVVPADWFWLPREYDTKDEVDALLADGRDPCNL